MDFIKECFEEHGSVLVDALEGAGFSVNQIIDFLPEAAMSIANLIRWTGVERTIKTHSLDDSLQLLSSINMQEIEQKLGLSSDLVLSGFKIITPFFLSHF